MRQQFLEKKLSRQTDLVHIKIISSQFNGFICWIGVEAIAYPQDACGDSGKENPVLTVTVVFVSRNPTFPNILKDALITAWRVEQHGVMRPKGLDGKLSHVYFFWIHTFEDLKDARFFTFGNLTTTNFSFLLHFTSPMQSGALIWNGNLRSVACACFQSPLF